MHFTSIFVALALSAGESANTVLVFALCSLPSSPFSSRSLYVISYFSLTSAQLAAGSTFAAPVDSSAIDGVLASRQVGSGNLHPPPWLRPHGTRALAQEDSFDTLASGQDIQRRNEKCYKVVDGSPVDLPCPVAGDENDGQKEFVGSSGDPTNGNRHHPRRAAARALKQDNSV